MIAGFQNGRPSRRYNQLLCRNILRDFQDPDVFKRIYEVGDRIPSLQVKQVPQIDQPMPMPIPAAPSETKSSRKIGIAANGTTLCVLNA